MAGPADYNSLVASTIKKFKKGFVDQIVRDNFLFAALADKDLAPAVFKREMREGESAFADGLKFENGGEKIFFPLMYAKNNTIQGYSGYDVLDITHAERFTAAEYEWKSIAGSLNLDNETIDKNAGNDVKLFDYVEGQMSNLKASLQDKVNEYLLSQKAAGAKTPLGLIDLIQDDPTSDPTVGAIGGVTTASGANTWWKNQAVTLNASFGTDQTGTGQAKVRELLRKTQFGRERAHVLLAGEIAYDRLERSMVNQIRYMGKAEQKLASSGFEAFQFKGIPVVLEKMIDTVRTDAGLTGSAFYALNLNFLKLYAMKHRFFEFSKVKEPTDQDTIVQHCIARMQFCTNGRRYQGVVSEVLDS